MKKKRYYVCKRCGHAIYYTKRFGYRCGTSCDLAIKGKEINNESIQIR